MILCILLLLVTTRSHSQKNEFKCSQNEPKPTISVPSDFVTETSANVYVVNEDKRNSTFVINCTSNQRVDWRFEGSIGNTLVKSDRSLTYEWYENNKGFSRICYNSALIFSAIEDEITGKYVCIVKPNLGFNPSNSQGLSSKIILFSGLSPMTTRNETKTYDLNWLLILLKNQKYDKRLYQYKLPCARNHPNATLSLFYTQSVNVQDPEWIQLQEDDFIEHHAVSINVHLSADQLPRKYKCEANLTNYFSETLYINIPSYPVSVFWPDVNDIVYKIHTYNVFYCISRIPIRFINDELQTSLEPTKEGFVQHYINMGFNYTSAVKIRNNDYNTNHFRREANLVGAITCEDINTNGSVINFSWKYSTASGNGNKNKDRRNQLNAQLKRADCKTSVNAEDVRVYFVKAATHAELSLQQKCLNLPSNEWNICNHPNSDLQPLADSEDPSVVYANLPKGTSGAFQCITPDVFNDGDHYSVFSRTILNELGNSKNPNQEYIRFLTSAHENVRIGDIIKTTCISSQMYFHGHGIWIIFWNNSTRSSVPTSWITADTITKNNTFYERRSDIIVGSLDITGFSCAALTILKVKDKRKEMVYPSPEYKQVHVKLKIPILSFLEITVIVLAVAVGLVVLVITVGFCWVRRHKIGVRDIVYEKILENFFNGYEPKVKDKNNIGDTAESQPYNGSYEILKEDLTISWDSPLGNGAFGYVLNGTYSVTSEKEQTKVVTRVAVKTLKDDADITCLKALMSELKVMIYVGRHENLVTLLGSITEKLAQRELYVVLEYCKNGSLQNYLKTNRFNFKNNFGMSKTSKEEFKRLYSNIRYSHCEIAFTSVSMFKWSRQIVSAMKYLVKKKVIHGDLATRNVLLDSSLTAKVSDFGLSRRLYETYEYVKKSHDPLPWRWMAIESLRDLTFSAETDVWSFGVTLWEIFSLAETPYIGNKYTSEFIKKLENDYRLSIPQHAPHQMYKLMIRCWHKDPDQRPTFHDLADELDNIIDAAVSPHHGNPHTDCAYTNLFE